MIQLIRPPDEQTVGGRVAHEGVPSVVWFVSVCCLIRWAYTGSTAVVRDGRGGAGRAVVVGEGVVGGVKENVLRGMYVCVCVLFDTRCVYVLCTAV